MQEHDDIGGGILIKIYQCYILDIDNITMSQCPLIDNLYLHGTTILLTYSALANLFVKNKKHLIIIIPPLAINHASSIGLVWLNTTFYCVLELVWSFDPKASNSQKYLHPCSAYTCSNSELGSLLCPCYSTLVNSNRGHCMLPKPNSIHQCSNDISCCQHPL